MEIKKEKSRVDQVTKNVKEFYDAGETLNTNKIINIIKVFKLQGYEIDSVSYIHTVENEYNGMDHPVRINESDLENFTIGLNNKDTEEITCIIHNNTYNGQAYFTVGSSKFEIDFQNTKNVVKTSISFNRGK